MRVVGDGALVAALSKATGDRHARHRRHHPARAGRGDPLPRVAASRSSRGGPGTGKTAVALHRAAYLLYSDRQRFAGGGVLVVGPSPVFVNYIARVLPSLGEDEVTLRSLGTLVPRHRGEPARRLARVATIKGSLRMARVLSRAARDDAARRADRAAPALPRHAAAAGPRRAEPAARHGAGARLAAQRGPRARPPGTSWTRSGGRPRELLGPGWKTRARRLRRAGRRAPRLHRVHARLVAGPAAGRRARLAGRPGPAARLRQRPARPPRDRRCWPALDPTPETPRSRSRTSRCSTSSDELLGAAAAASRAQPATRTRSAAYARSPRTPTARRPPARPRTSGPTTTASTRTSSSTRRRTSRRCSGG